MSRRLPAASEVTLRQRRLFIFPSAAGLAFLCMLLVMLVAAINYQNNMAYALTFLLGCTFVVAVHHTFANLYRLTLCAVSVDHVFPGQQAAFSIKLTSAGARRYRGLRLGWSSVEQMHDIEPGRPHIVVLHHAVNDRGWYQPGRFLLETRHPIGLLRCWTWVDLNLRALVYPRPLPPPAASLQRGDDADGAVLASGNGEDVADFKRYQPGDALRSVNWRAWAKGHALTTKVYGEPVGKDQWLDFDHFESGSTEQRLSWLCAMVLAAHEARDCYGLRLPGTELPPGSGEGHRDAALRALALFGNSDQK